MTYSPNFWDICLFMNRKRKNRLKERDKQARLEHMMVDGPMSEETQVGRL